MNFSFLIFCFFTVYKVTSSDGIAEDECRVRKEDCVNGECYRSTPCHHGNCDDNGGCICNACWQGASCDIYVDTYPPQFPFPKERVTVRNVWTPHRIHTVRAVDTDQDSTCPDKEIPCDCSQIRYFLADDAHLDLFTVDPITGGVTIIDPSEIEVSRNYTLLIGAHGIIPALTNSNFTTSTVMVTITIEPLEGVMDYEDYDVYRSGRSVGMHHLQETAENSLRTKRNANELETNYRTEFKLTMLSGEPDNMQIGKRINYRLDITVPKTDKMDMIVEIFTRDIGKADYTPTLTLFDLVVEPETNKGSLRYSNGQVVIDRTINPDIPTVYDRFTLDFGDISNRVSPTSITITFSVTMVRNPATVFDQSYYVTVGAEYQQETYVWVSQSEVIARNTEDSRLYEMDVSGPDSIALDSAGVFTVDAYLTARSDNITVEVLGPQHQGIVSIGNLGVVEFGRHYAPLPQDIYYYNTTLVGSDELALYQSAHMNLGILTNVGPLGQDPRSDNNRIRFSFAVFGLKKEENVGELVTVTAGLVVGNDLVWTALINITLTPREDSSKFVAAGSPRSLLTVTQAAPGDMVLYPLLLNISHSGFCDLKLEVEVPKVKGLPLLEPCSARLQKVPLSFKIPNVNTTFVDPELLDLKRGKYVFVFPRIHVTDQRSPSKYNDTEFRVEVVIKISGVEGNKVGKKVKPTFTFSSQGPELKVDIQPLILSSVAESRLPVVSVRNAADWSNLYSGGYVVMNISVEVPPQAGYSSVVLETKGVDSGSLPSLHLCRAEMTHVDRNLPCLRMHMEEVNQKQIKYKRREPSAKPDQVQIVLGDVGALPLEGANSALVTLVLGIPEMTDGVDDESLFPVHAGLRIGSVTAWAAIANYTLRTVPVPAVTEEKAPAATAALLSTDPVTPGFLVEMEIVVQTATMSLGSYTVEVIAAGSDLSVCDLRVESVGRNIPCGTEDALPAYFLHDNPVDGNKRAVMEFKVLANVGQNPDDPEIDAYNRIRFLALVRVSPAATIDPPVKWIVHYGSGSLEDTLIVPLADSGGADIQEEDVSPPKSLTFRPAHDGKEVSVRSPVVVALNLELEPNSVVPITVTLRSKTKKSVKSPFSICLGGVTFRGKNYPCFSPQYVRTTISSSNPSKSPNDTVNFDLGLVCNTYIDRTSDIENTFQLQAALLPVSDGSLKAKDTIVVDGEVVFGKTIHQLPAVKFTMAKNPDEVETADNVTMTPSTGADIPIQVRQRLWIPFNITIPVASIVKVEVQVKAPDIADRAVLTLHAVRLVSGGVNIPCPDLFSRLKVNLMSTVSTTQKDMGRATIGYFTNLGLTHTANTASEGDDDITVEAEVELTDHPVVVHDATFQVAFEAIVGSGRTSSYQTIVVVRDGSERPQLETTAVLGDTSPHPKGELVNVHTSIRHSETSTAEPINTTLRFYLPPYVSVISVSGSWYGAGRTPVIDKQSSLDVVFPVLMFPDDGGVNFTLLIDPEKKGMHGPGEVRATTPFRLLCHQVFRNSPVANPVTPETINNCSPTQNLELVMRNEECYEPLGMSNPNIIKNCQITASSAATRDRAPYKARRGRRGAWSPELRLGPNKPYLQVDFQRKTRVSRIQLDRVKNSRAITKFKLLYSNYGLRWSAGNEVTSLVYENDVATDDLKLPFEARYIRLVIEEAEEENQDTSYVGVKLEIYGCYLEKKFQVSCEPDITIYSDNEATWGRHFAVDGARDIIYFCNPATNTRDIACFSSADGGSSWRRLGWNVASLVGFDPGTRKMFVADREERAFLASEDSLHWTTVPSEIMTSTLNKTHFRKRLSVPALTRSDIAAMKLKTGKWQATFDGLFYNEGKHPKVKWSSCCMESF